MLEVVSDKLRFYELAPVAPAWVHTVELSRGPAHFITLWVCSPRFETIEQMVECVALRPDIAEHSPSLFHSDDETYLWIEQRYPRQDQRHWRQHYHWRYPFEPTAQHVFDLLSDLGLDCLSRALLDEVIAVAQAPALAAVA